MPRCRLPVPSAAAELAAAEGPLALALPLVAPLRLLRPLPFGHACLLLGPVLGGFFREVHELALDDPLRAGLLLEQELQLLGQSRDRGWPVPCPWDIPACPGGGDGPKGDRSNTFSAIPGTHAAPPALGRSRPRCLSLGLSGLSLDTHAWGGRVSAYALGALRRPHSPTPPR